jgi:hypothetical protein
VTTHAKWFVLVAAVLAGLVAALSGCSDLGGPANSNGNVPGGPDENGIKLGTVTLTYDLESKSGTAEFVPNAQVSGEANIDTLTGISFVWGKSTYDKRGVIPSLGLPGPAAVVSLAISNTSSYMILGPYMQFPTTLSGFRVDYPTAADAAPLEIGDPDVVAAIGATGWQRWVAENDGGVTAGAVTTTDHGWASSYNGQVLNVVAPPPGDTRPDGFLTEYDALAADKTFTIRFMQLDPAVGVPKTWAPFYDENGDTATFGPTTTLAPGLFAQPDATPPSPVACAVPMRFQQMPNGETPTKVVIAATLYADALLDARNVYDPAMKYVRWDALKTTIGGFDIAADQITSVTRDANGDVLVGWLDASAGAVPGQFMFQFSRLHSDLTMVNAATIPITQGVRTLGGVANVRGFAVNAARNRAFVAIDTIPGTGTVFSFDATTGAQADGGTALNVAAQQGMGAFTPACRISDIASDDTNGLVYVAYGNGVPGPGTIARVIGYGLNGSFVPTTQACASPAAGLALFLQWGGPLLVGGKLGVDGTGRVFVSSGINPSPNGIARLVRSGANLNLDAVFDIDSLTTVPAIAPAAQTYDMFAVAPGGSVTAYINDFQVPHYDVSYSPDLPGDNGPGNFRDPASPLLPVWLGFVHFSASGTWDASTWARIVRAGGGTASVLGGLVPTAMFYAGPGPAGTQKSVLLCEVGIGGPAQMAFLNM